jgi:hypothetical protein
MGGLGEDGRVSSPGEGGKGFVVGRMADDIESEPLRPPRRGVWDVYTRNVKNNDCQSR